MKFAELLIAAIQRSEIPLRFEPGAEEAVAAPVTELIRDWLLSHGPELGRSEFYDGQRALIERLIAELDGAREVPASR
jgi:hypothetical protein